MELPLSILLAEDDAISIALVESVLKDAGYTVILVETGDQAIMELQKKRTKLLITSIHLRGLNGMQLLEHVRSSDSSHMPVLGLSANYQILKTETGHHFDELIPRPITAGSLLRAVDRLLEAEDLG